MPVRSETSSVPASGPDTDQPPGPVVPASVTGSLNTTVIMLDAVAVASNVEAPPMTVVADERVSDESEASDIETPRESS